MTKIITQTSQWRPVEFNADNLSVEGLIGIEELTDYSLDAVVTPSLKRGKRKPPKTRKKTVKRQKTESTVKTERGNDPADYFAWENLHVPRELARPLVESGFVNPTEIQVCGQIYTSWSSMGL
jgi:hypothetical protein